MTRIEVLDHIPNYTLLQHSEWELQFEAKDALLRESAVVGQVVDDGMPLAVYGLVYKTFTGPGWFWCFLTEAVAEHPLRAVRALRVAMESMPPDVYTAVLCSNAAANKFAKLFGFEWVDGGAMNGDRAYNIYRRA